MDTVFTGKKRLRNSSSDGSTPQKKRCTKESMAALAPSIEERNEFLDKLKVVFPRSAILNVTSLKIGPKHNKGIATHLPPTIMSLRSLKLRNILAEELTTKIDEIFQHLKFSEEFSSRSYKAAKFPCLVRA